MNRFIGNFRAWVAFYLLGLIYRIAPHDRAEGKIICNAIDVLMIEVGSEYDG
jgi:hypothetical protein